MITHGGDSQKTEQQETAGGPDDAEPLRAGFRRRRELIGPLIGRFADFSATHPDLIHQDLAAIALNNLDGACQSL